MESAPEIPPVIYMQPDGLFDFRAEIELVSLSAEDVPYPVVEDDFLPLDPFLRMIALKKMFFSTNFMEDSPFEENTATTLYCNESSYFVGTLRGGVYQYDLENKLETPILESYDSLSNRAVTQISGNDNLLFISTYSGLFMYDRLSGTLNNLTASMKDTAVLTHTTDGEHLYWGTASGGFYILRPDADPELIYRVEGSLRVIHKDGSFFYLGTGSGHVYIHDSRSGETIEIGGFVSDQDFRINSLCRSGGFSYIGTSAGLFRYNENTAHIDLFFDGESILESASSENYIYFGTHSSGVVIYDKINDIYTLWGLGQGIPSLNIPAVGVADGQVLLGIPDKGILIINEEIHEKL